jgi:hypothetical protein
MEVCLCGGAGRKVELPVRNEVLHRNKGDLPLVGLAPLL